MERHANYLILLINAKNAKLHFDSEGRKPFEIALAMRG